MKLGPNLGSVVAFVNPMEDGKIGRNFLDVRVNINLRKPLVDEGGGKT